MRKGKLGLLLLSVMVVALALSSCFLPPVEDHTPPTIAVSPSPITAYSGQSFSFNVTANDNSGIQYIDAAFMNQAATKTTSPATFTFTAPVVGQATQYQIKVNAVDNSKFHNPASQNVTLNVYPITTGTVTYSVKLNNPDGIYVYPAAPAQNSSVIFSVAIFGGANLISGVNVYVDGVAVPASPVSFSSSAKITAESSPMQEEYTAFYPISAQTAGPHTYYVTFFNKSGDPIQQSGTGWFYITYPGVQKVSLSEATPTQNATYLTGNVSFTATATDYTSNYEALLINGTPYATFVNYSVGATRVVNGVYNIPVDTTALPDGPATFVFKDVSIGGNVVTATRTYVVDNANPVLRASYQSFPASGTTLYVGSDPTTFEVYAYDAYWMTSQATLGGYPFALTKNGTALADVAGLANGQTKPFTAWVKDYANHEATLTLTIVRDTVPPTIHYANITGLATVNGVPNSASSTITVTASVTDNNLKSVAFSLDGYVTVTGAPIVSALAPITGKTYTFPLTKNASGLWTATINLGGVLPGTYHGTVIATDLALNHSSLQTVPPTVNVYRPLTSVFTTSMTTSPSAPVNGFVKSATVTANIGSTWIYAVKYVTLWNGTTPVSTKIGNGASAYNFTSFTGTGTYHVVLTDTVNATITDGVPYPINIDSASPTNVTISPIGATVNTTSKTFTVSATDTQSGIASISLMYQTLGGTGANNGPWVTVGTINTYSGTVTWNNINTLPDGKYNIKAVAADGVGNTSATTTYIINDNAGTPTVTPVFPAAWTNSTSTVVEIGATVKNESDVTVTAILESSTSTTSNSYNAYPLTQTWSGTFTSANATYLASVNVTDLASHSVTATKVVGFDNVKPTLSVNASSVVAGNGATFTVTLTATDNLSAIKSVSAGGVNAAVSATTSANEFGVLNGTYVATITVNQTTSGTVTYTATAMDNAGNTVTKTFAVYVDVNAPHVLVQLVNNNGAQTIANGASETNYTSTPASFTWAATTDGGVTPLVSVSIMPSEFSSTTAAGAYSIPSSGTYVITVIATNPTNGLSTTFRATKTVVVDNTNPTVNVTAPGTVNFSSTSAIATYTATDVNFQSALLKVYDANGTLYSTTLTAPVQNKTVDLLPYLGSVNGNVVTITITATDKALNHSTATDTFYVDTIQPTITNVYKTMSGSGTMYIQISQPIATSTTFTASNIRFVQAGLTFYASQVGFDKTTGLIFVTKFVDENGNTVWPQDIGGTWNVYVSNITDIGGNEISNSGSAWDIARPQSPRPVNP